MPPATVHPLPSASQAPLFTIGPMPPSPAGRAVWAKTLMIECARIWAETMNLRSNASAEDIQAVHDECADVLDAFLQMARHFTNATGGDYRDLEARFRDAFSDGLEYPLARWLEDMGADADRADERIGAFEAGVGRYR